MLKQPARTDRPSASSMPYPASQPGFHEPLNRQVAVDNPAAKEQDAGTSWPLGATASREGVNFSVYSRDATAMQLLLFENANSAVPARIVHLDHQHHRTLNYWHTFVRGLKPGQIYCYKAAGTADPDKALLDPYARIVVVPETYDRERAKKPGDNTDCAMKSVVIDSSTYDWENDAPLRRPSSRTIIYELHVRGFTQHSSSGLNASLRGTFKGLIEKIPYLKQLGITAVELLPVFQFDPYDSPAGTTNYWGYSPVSFFAPHSDYGTPDDFRDMVKALHRAGIEVILDVVYNHTAEGDHTGPTQCFRGFDPSTYYILENDGTRYANYSGTGNTLNANDAVVRRLILDSLRYWVTEMHVDGFRFDLASILSRDKHGRVLATPPVLWEIDSDPVLAGTKLIAEAWDAAGLYQVGSFIGDSWKEWNAHFRDDARSFFRGEQGAATPFADRFIGSPNIFAHERREPEQAVNFVTCHDGFTLNDLVSYDQKHNKANGEDNRDGTDYNRSWNCGVEGPTSDPAIELLRNRQVKNFLTATMLSVGIPMLTMGDEVRRTQHGNNNPYCQDNEISWFDWRLLETHADILRFVQLLTERRMMRNSNFGDESQTLTEMLRQAQLEWHGLQPGIPDWSAEARYCSFTAVVPAEVMAVHFIFNAFWEPLTFTLPALLGSRKWFRWIDTAMDSPNDIVAWQSAPVVQQPHYRVAARTTIVLFSPEADFQ